MANSLTDWLAAKVASCVQDAGADSIDLHNKQTLLEDIAYVRGAKVQIYRFFAPQVIQEVQVELNSLEEGEELRKGTQGGIPTNACNNESHWAVVADKANSVHVQFSSHCVARFNSTNARELISLRGAIISLRSFRPSVSFLPSLLDNRQNKAGPFAALPTARPLLFLEIESFEVLGSINEVTFWQAGNLQLTLSSKEKEPNSFRKWFKMVEKMMLKEQNRAKRKRLKLEAGDTNSNLSSSLSRKSADTSSISASATFTTESMPPPFQKPNFQKQESQEKEPESQASSTIKKEKSAWGDFTLSQSSIEDEDEFGLEAAASQLIERHEQGLEIGEQEDAQIVDSLDSIFPSANSKSTNGDRNLLDSQNEHESSQNASTQSAQEKPSQTETLPATYPTDSMNREIRGNTSDVRPPSVTDTTSLPFSLLINEESLGPETQKESEDIFTEEPYKGRDEEDVDMIIKPFLPGKPFVSDAARVVQESKRETSTQTDSAEGIRSKSVPTQQNLTTKSTLCSSRERCATTVPSDRSETKKWNNTIRKLTPEEIKERDRTYSSRVDLIVD